MDTRTRDEILAENETLRHRLKEAEGTLRESMDDMRDRERLLLQTIMNSSGNAHLVYLDRDFNFVLVNETYAATCGFRTDEMIGKNHFALYPHAENEAIFARVRDTGEPVAFHDKPFVFPDQPERGVTYWDWTLTPVKDNAGNVEGVIFSLFETTERRQVEIALKLLNEELEQRVAARTAELREKDQLLLAQSRQAAMGEMLQHIAHQWRQPLNNLALMIQKLPLMYKVGQFSKEVLDETVSSSMGVIQHMSRTIDDFRNFIAPAKEKGSFSVVAVVKDSVSLIADTLKSRRIALEVAATEDPVAFGYRNELTHVLLNIMNNAVDALVERRTVNPTVTIRVGTEDGRPVMTIGDNAGGVPLEDIDRIFEPYFTTKAPRHGTGLGLFMSRGIIEKNMGGRLTVCNTAEGAEFKIVI